jgi:phage shock protein A
MVKLRRRMGSAVESNERSGIDAMDWVLGSLESLFDQTPAPTATDKLPSPTTATEKKEPVESLERMLEQSITELYGDLMNVRTAYSDATSRASYRARRARERILWAEAEAVKLYDRAQEAIERDELEVARNALKMRKQQIKQAKALKESFREGADSAMIASLYERMKQLEAKMAEVKTKKDKLVMRARAAKAAKTAQQATIQAGGKSTASDGLNELLERFERGIETLEEEARSPQEEAGQPIEEMKAPRAEAVNAALDEEGVKVNSEKSQTTDGTDEDFTVEDADG